MWRKCLQEHAHLTWRWGGRDELWKLPSNSQVSSSSNEERIPLRRVLQEALTPSPWDARGPPPAISCKIVLFP